MSRKEKDRREKCSLFFAKEVSSFLVNEVSSFNRQKKYLWDTLSSTSFLSLSQHYCLLFKDHSLLQTLSRKPTSRPHPRYKILMCCLQARYHFVTYNKLCSNFTGPLLVALQKAIIYSMKRNGPGRHKSLTQFFFLFWYFNKFLFRYILHFFTYWLTNT